MKSRKCKCTIISTSQFQKDTDRVIIHLFTPVCVIVAPLAVILTYFLFYVKKSEQTKFKKKMSKYTLIPFNFTNEGSKIIFNQ